MKKSTFRNPYNVGLIKKIPYIKFAFEGAKKTSAMVLRNKFLKRGTLTLDLSNFRLFPI